MPTESAKTMMYVAIAAVMALAGMFLAPTGPKAAKDGIESLIGTEFYKSFTNPSEATSIEVIGYDPVTATATPFSVEYKDGLWRIPTRNNYPADAKDRLAKVAASIIGLKRESLAGRTESEQVEFQVLDPKAEKAENLKGIGNRVTLRNGNTVLADYIIGKPVANRSGYFYVRKPEEKATFTAKVDLNLSTKFTDWIESDVLNLEATKLTEIDIHKYSLQIARNKVALKGEEVSELTRKNSSDPWQLKGLDEAKEEVNQDEVRKLVTALDDLKIVGVRPKPAPLRELARSGEPLLPPDQETEMDFFNRGFVFLQTQRGVSMYSKEGRLLAGTDQGVEYDLRFGDTFEGTEEEIELGFAKPKEDEEKTESPEDGEKKDDAESKDDAEKSDAEKKEDAKKKDDEPASPGKKKSRFMFVTARVNPELFGPALEEPVKPEPPTEEKPAAEEKSEEKASDDKKADDKKQDELKETQKKDEQPAEEKASDEKPADEKPAEEEKVDPKKAYEEALKKYAADKVKYESDLKSREDKVKEAEEKVKTLNARFADWYYVISAESFANLRQGRDTLVKEKPEAEKSEEKTESEGDDEKKEDEAKEKPAAEKPAAKKDDQTKAAAPKTAAPKAAAPKTSAPAKK